MSATYALEGQKDKLDDYIGGAGTIKVGLYTANAGSGKNTALSHLTAATFSGYATQTPSWATGTTDANLKYNRVGGTCTYTHNGGGTSNSVLGYYVWNDTTGKLLFFEAFGAPISMASNGDTITITPTWFEGDASTPL